MALPEFVAPLAAAGVALLALGWAITRYVIDRPSHRIAELHEAADRARAVDDPLAHLYRALICEQVVRRFLPSRREFWTLGTIWLWLVVAVSPWAGRDLAVALGDTVAMWVILLAFMVSVGLLIALASYFTREMIRTIGWGTDAVHLRVTDLLVESRRSFLEATEGVPEFRPSSVLRSVLDSTRERRVWQARDVEGSDSGSEDPGRVE